jgi:outer membrane biosynthesis protein TonB
MAKITISIELDNDYENLETVLIQSGLLAAYQGAAEDPKPEAPKPEAPKPEAPKHEDPKAEDPKPEAPKPEAPKPEAPKPEAPKPEAPKAETTPLDEEAPKSGSGVTLAALRVVLSTKVGAHRQAIKDKLSTLGGASTVSTLSVDHYDEFNEFMQSLK